LSDLLFLFRFCSTGQTYTIPVEFKQAKDYPIDLYFLMDLSNSMADDKASGGETDISEV
jgi:hypothetical protein